VQLRLTSLNSNQSNQNLRKWRDKAPLVIAHRGASDCAPENTMSAFRKALTLGADAIELDTQLSADGEVMVFHDASLDRTTNGSGPLSSFSSCDLRKLDAGVYFGPDFIGEKIPFMHEVLCELGQSLRINIELKNLSKPFNSLPDRVIELVRKHHVEGQILLSSFNPLALVRAKQRSPELPVALLVSGREPRWMRIFLEGILQLDAFHPHHKLLNTQVVEAHHKRSRLVNAWTVDDAERMLVLWEWGVDGVITNKPELARESMESAGYIKGKLPG